MEKNKCLSNYLPTSYQEFIHLSRYSRWLPEKERRETWDETVARYFDFFTEHLKETVNFTLSKELRTELEQAVLGLRVMPSMRCIMTAGEALKRENIAGYNCSYVAVDRPQAFDEILYILMNGTGVGFSVERQYVSQLPTIADEFFETDTTITVADSKLGWAKALKELIGMLYIGQIPRWDLSKVRPAGAPLKTFGGRASGPEPLESLMNFTVNVFKNAAGRKLSSIEAHDVVCKIAEVVVVGGVRRSALISLSNLSDDRMRAAKSGQWWNDNPQRALANNSCMLFRKQISVCSWTSGSLFMIPSQVSVVSSIVSPPYGWHQRMVAETQRTMSLAQTHVQRLFYAIVSSVIYQRLWFVHLIHGVSFGEGAACNDSWHIPIHTRKLQVCI